MKDDASEILARYAPELDPNDVAFCERVFASGLSVYRERLEAVELRGRGRVLDAGCGFGQWSLALAELNEEVCACDIAGARVGFLGELAARSGVGNLRAAQGKVDRLPFADRSFDAVFCYGVIFCADWLAALDEFARVTRPGARLYLTANGLGWTINLWERQPNKAGSYDPREIAALNFDNTLRYEREGVPPRRGQLIIPSETMEAALVERGFRVVARGAEGTLQLGETKPRPFFAESYAGLEGVYEVIAERT